MQKDKTRIWSKKVFQPFLSHIRVLSKRINRGYGPKNFVSLFLSRIRVLSKGIKVMYLVYLVQFSPNLKLPGIGKMKQNSKLILFHLETDA
jgi:hypothetical protein